jgi:hypothetical protein
MKNMMCGGVVAAVLATLSPGVGAQDQKTDKMDRMKSASSYTGCVQRSQDGAFTLTHAMASDSGGKKAMMKDSMTKDSMAKEPKDSMMKESMAPVLELSSTSVHLDKHVGHKVTIRGIAGDAMGGMSTFSVTSIKMVGSSCS